MSELHDEPFPRGVLIAAALLLVTSIALAGIARNTQIGVTATPESVPVVSRFLSFEDRPDGTVAVYTHPAGDDRREEVALLAPGTNGFVRSVMRGLARERRQYGVGSQPDFRLTRWADGRLSLEDTATGRRIELDAFGPTNTAAFAVLLGEDGAREIASETTARPDGTDSRHL